MPRGIDPARLVENARFASLPAVVILGVSIAVDAAILAVDVSSPQIVGEQLSPLRALLFLTQVFVFLCTVWAFLIWFFRSVKAVSAMTPRPFPYSPGAAVVYFFIPLFNIFRPFQVMARMFDSSTPLQEPVSSGTRVTMWVWWPAWLLANTFLATGGGNPSVEGDVIGHVCSIASAVALILLIRQLPKLQVRRLKEWTESQPPPMVDGVVEYPRYPDVTQA